MRTPPRPRRALRSAPRALSDIPGLLQFDPPGPCVYFLCYLGEVVYVGETLHLGARLFAHEQDKKFNQVFFIPVAQGWKRRRRVERKYIRKFRPRLNEPYRELRAKWEAATKCEVLAWRDLRLIRVRLGYTTDKNEREVLSRYISSFPNRPDLETLPDWLLPQLSAPAPRQEGVPS